MVNHSSASTVFIVDDDPQYLRLLEILVKSIHLNVRTFGSADEFLQHYDPTTPGALVVDMRLPGMSGIQLQERLTAERLRIPTIVITAHPEVSMAVKAMKAGAIDYVEKEYEPQNLLDKIRLAIKDDLEFRRLNGQSASAIERLKSLSPRERAVLKRLIDGQSDADISRELGINLSEVDFHKRRVLEIMEVENVISLVRQVTWLTDSSSLESA